MDLSRWDPRVAPSSWHVGLTLSRGAQRGTIRSEDTGTRRQSKDDTIPVGLISSNMAGNVLKSQLLLQFIVQTSALNDIFQTVTPVVVHKEMLINGY